MSLMLKELQEASQAIKNVLSTNNQTATEIAKEFKKRKLSIITTVARGSSNNAASFFRFVCEKESGIMVTKYNHSVTTICGKEVNLAKSLCMGISQSGMSSDTIMVMEMAKKQGALTVAVTNDTNSPLAKLCDYHLFLNCSEEKSVAATKTYTLQIANLHMLANILGGKQAPDFDKIAEEMQAFTKSFAGIKELAEKTKTVNNFVILSRGQMLPIADEMSLKMLETCYKFSRCFSVAEFAHGPYAIIEKGKQVVLFAPQGEFTKDFEAIFSRLKQDGAEILPFSNIASLLKTSCMSYEINTSQEAEPYIYILALQAYAAYMSEALGLNPDKPRGLKKVTITT